MKIKNDKAKNIRDTSPASRVFNLSFKSTNFKIRNEENKLNRAFNDPEIGRFGLRRSDLKDIKIGFKVTKGISKAIFFYSAKNNCSHFDAYNHFAPYYNLPKLSLEDMLSRQNNKDRG